MKKIKIRDKEYNCSNKVYWHIKGLKSENECFSMEIKSHEQSEYKLEQENKRLKDNWDKLKEYCKTHYYGITTIGILEIMQELEKGENDE